MKSSNRYAAEYAKHKSSRMGAKSKFAHPLPASLESAIRNLDVRVRMLRRAFEENDLQGMREIGLSITQAAQKVQSTSESAADSAARVSTHARDNAKAEFDAHWKEDYKERAVDRINDGMSLISKCEAKQREISKTIKFLNEAIARMNEAVRTKNSSLLYQCEREIYDADNVRRSFSRTGAKSTHAANDSVSRKIATLVRDGYDQKQAAAIAYDMKRRGEI